MSPAKSWGCLTSGPARLLSNPLQTHAQTLPGCGTQHHNGCLWLSTVLLVTDPSSGLPALCLLHSSSQETARIQLKAVLLVASRATFNSKPATGCQGTVCWGGLTLEFTLPYRLISL